jgi:hypothetical protein
MNTYNNNREEQKNLFVGFVGLQNFLNQKTSFMVEVQTIPQMKTDAIHGRVSPEQRIVYTAGIRFLALKWLYIDTGMRYQDNYRGLADTEVKLGLNGIWNFSGD